MLRLRAGAAGSEAAAAGMAAYLMEQTLPNDYDALTRYYARGQDASMTMGDLIRDAARKVADGDLLFSEATADICMAYLRSPAADREDEPLGPETERRLMDALVEASVFYAEGGQDERHGTRPEVRQDMHPHVAAALGLDPARVPSEQEIAHLFAGRRADGSEQPGATRQISFLDLTWSVDKSVSLAWAFAPTAAEQASIHEAFAAAVDDAMAYVEREVGIARQGEPPRFSRGHIGWINFDHYTSRPTLELVVSDAGGGMRTEMVTLRRETGDPHLHRHVAVFNVVATEDGWVGGLFQARFHGRIKEFGAYFQGRLATRLRAIGADVAMDPENGAARIMSVPQRVRLAYRKRSDGAERIARDAAKAQGLDWDRMTGDAQVAFIRRAALDSRQAKDDPLPDFEGWRRRAEALGWEHRGALVPERARDLAPTEQRIERAYELALPWVEALLEQRAVIGVGDIREQAARALVATGIEDHRDISRVTQLFRERGVRLQGQMTDLIWGEDGGGTRITTALQRDQEAEFIRLVQAAARSPGGLTRGQLQAQVKVSGLNFRSTHGKAQEAAMWRFATAGRIGVFIGAPGAGKTAILSPMIAAHRARGDTIHGIAVAHRHADRLMEAGVLPAERTALDPFLRRAAEGKLTLDRRSVVFVDEISVMGSRQGLELMRLQERYGFTLRLVGDDKQAQSVEAAPAVRLLRLALGQGAIPEVNSTIRQKTPGDKAKTDRERRIVGLFREGQADLALAMKREDGTLEVVPGGHRETIQRAAALWADLTRRHEGEAGYTLTVSAPTNEDAQAISVAIRHHRRAMGQIREDIVPALAAADQGGRRYTMALAPGDRVRLFDRVWADQGGKRVHVANNGTVLEVAGATRKALLVKHGEGVAAIDWDVLRRRDREGRVRLAYGDVLTIDASMGDTVSDHILALPRGTASVDAFKALVGNSRHRGTTYMVVSDGQERQDIARGRMLNDGRPITPADVEANMARNLSAQNPKGTATEFLKRARNVERAAARGFQGAQRLREARLQQGPLAPLVEQAGMRLRMQQALGRVAQRLGDGLQGRLQERIDRRMAAGLEAARQRPR